MVNKAIAIVGPTASGKTRRAVAVAEAFGGEIISADSRQVYRKMDIGTGKDLGEYGNIPYWLIDIADAGEKYNLHRYLMDFRQAYDNICARGRVPVICGGSGMYVENALAGVSLPEVPENRELRSRLEGKPIDELATILSGYKELHNTTDIDTCKRAIRAIEIQEYYRTHPHECVNVDARVSRPLDALVVGVDIPREIRRLGISRRLKSRLNEGMVEEIKSIIDSGVAPEDLIYYGLEYKFVTLYLIGQLSYTQMVHDLEIAIHQFAKRQMTWFRGMEKRGIPIHWLPYDMPDAEFIGAVKELLRLHPLKFLNARAADF
ncbi:MAG: tRNA (adenosine(37)-N6)-dimethylallyltransferase MiaA [Muribaculaceae bacterium]|nr:tRNA (adenosine(37)-N6)-dimethylallyltransferase MiaA [Muribaculaceae bacterium]